jgi:hypothetical protein
MKQLFLITLSLTLCIYGWWQIRDYAWTPASTSRWNPFALKESGFGRTLARVLTEQANTSYHHGLLEGKPPVSTNPFSHWLDAGENSLGFQGRLKYRPIDQYPLRPYEVKQALEQVEKNLRLAFELDPSNYTAYDVYFFFLTTEVTQTEFASMEGTQLKDDDNEDSAQPGSETQAPQIGSQAKEAVDPKINERNSPARVFQRWARKELQRRQIRAIEITDEAIRKFRPNTLDPERFLTASVMWYNRFMLLAPDPTERQRSAAARRKFEEVGPLTLYKMTYYIDAAKACQQELEQKGLWRAIPERRSEYLRVMQLIDKCASALSVTLQHNRTEMFEDGQRPSIWGPLGQN